MMQYRDSTPLTDNASGARPGGGHRRARPSYFNHPGVAVTVSSGDGGYGVEYPAASKYVTAVGGTKLVKDSSARGWSESVWNASASEGGGSGCSEYDAKPTWQTDTGCANRTVADVSADAGTPCNAYPAADLYAHTSSLNDVTTGATASCTPAYLCTAEVGYDGPTGLGIPNGLTAFTG